jgi:hypothetical protein
MSDLIMPLEQEEETSEYHDSDLIREVIFSRATACRQHILIRAYVGSEAGMQFKPFWSARQLFLEESERARDDRV